MSEKNAKHMIKPGMHYATLVALVVSNLTVFGLAALMASLMVGQPMGEIAGYSAQLQVQKSLAKITTVEQRLGPKLQKKCGAGGCGGSTSVPAAATWENLWLYTWGMNISFTDNSDNSSFFVVERADTLGPSINWQPVAETAAIHCGLADPGCIGTNLYSLADDSVQIITSTYPSWEYIYRVKTYDANGLYSISGTMNISPYYDAIPPDPVQNFRIASQECQVWPASPNGYNTLVTYEWDQVMGDNPVPGASGIQTYVLYKTNPTNPGFVFGITPDEVTTWTDYNHGSNNIITYDRWIVSSDVNQNKSADSQRITVTIPECPPLGSVELLCSDLIDNDNDGTYDCGDSDCALDPACANEICAGPGLRADVYGGPNQQCCSGLILQGGVCNLPS